MKIVFLDVKTIGEDLDLSAFDEFGEVIKYPFTSIQEAPDHVADADVIILNKVLINETTIGKANNLKLVCVTGTGTNHLDKEYLKSRGISWRNVAGYSTESVAQHTFAMLLFLLEKLRFYDDYVKEDRYTNDISFSHFEEMFYQIQGKTWGIIGLGNIGRRVASIAEAFGAHVIYTSPSGNAPQEGYTQVDMDTLLKDSDIISVHAPLNEYTENLIDASCFAKMKKNCIFLNLGRGAIVIEQDLANALNENQIRAAGVDVLTTEPMSPENPLRQIKDSRKLFITPHIAWASVEARTNLMNIIFGQIKDFFY
ncbi:MAG: D-2-hydroxyacid dehydrogenase [Dorea sp.]